MAEGEAGSGSKDPLMEMREMDGADSEGRREKYLAGEAGTEPDSSRVEDTATVEESSREEDEEEGDAPEPAAKAEDEPIQPAEKTEAAARPSEAAHVPEKLADDVIRPPLWKRVLYGVFPSLERSEFFEEDYIRSLTNLIM